MNLKQIESALEVSKTLNFNKAAQILYITQPALSYQIKTLEDEIGFKIFDRENNVRITPAGRRFCSRLEVIRSEINMAIAEGQCFAQGICTDSCQKYVADNVIPYDAKQVRMVQ